MVLRLLLLLLFVSFVSFLLLKMRMFRDRRPLRNVHRAATGALIVVALVYSAMVGMAVWNSG